jgi:hypothetical protein
MIDDAQRSGMSDEELKAWRRRENEAYIETIRNRANDGTGRGGVAFDHAVSKIVIDGDSLNFNALNSSEMELIGEGFFGPGMMVGPITRAELRARVRKVSGPFSWAIFPHTKEYLEGFEHFRLKNLAGELKLPAMRELAAAARPEAMLEKVRRLRDELAPKHARKGVARAIADAINEERERAGDMEAVSIKRVQNLLSELHRT